MGRNIEVLADGDVDGERGVVDCDCNSETAKFTETARSRSNYVQSTNFRGSGIDIDNVGAILY